MKKLLTHAAVVMTAAITHAAAVGWTMGGATGYATYDIFVIGMNGVTDAAQIAALVATGSSVSSYAFYEGGTVTASGAANLTSAASGKSIAYSGSGTDTYSAFAVLWKEDGKEASYTSTASISMVNDSTSKNFGFANQSTNLANNKFAVGGGSGGGEPVPEPTSGLLMLIGAAGLALRRKRA